MVLLGGVFGWRVTRALRKAAQEVRWEREIRFTVRQLPPPAGPDFEWISAPAVFTQACEFQGHLFVAGPAGLLEYDALGNLLKQYSVGRELPVSPLVGIAPAMLADSHEPELLLATAQQGVVAFNGRGFRQIVPEDADARTTTAMLPLASGRLLIGTKKRGVLLYDGRRISVFHSTLSGLYVTTLAGSESDLWVGTLDRGVLHWHAGQTDSFGEEQGLPDRQVQSIALSGEKVYVGTALGTAEFDHGQFSRVLAGGVFARALLARRDELFIGSMDQGVIVIPLHSRRRNSAERVPAAWDEVQQLFQSGASTLALTGSALYEVGAHGFGRRQVLQRGGAILSDRNVSALAAGPDGRLWAGYFDRGLDLLAADGTRAAHVENERVFCINRILPNPRSQSVEVATANGLVRFDSAGNQKQVLTRSDGLIADQVTDAVLYRGGLALATPAGLTFLDSSGARSLYAFHGLVNNHVYALAASGDELVAGTLGGLSVLDKGEVRANYTTATSALQHNWITAVVAVGEEWMVGTYGAGILRLERGGRFQPLETATAPFEVNPNAMLATAGHVLAGTLGRGLYVYDRASQRWSVIDTGLPSWNVTALAATRGYIYVGTDNGLVRIKEQDLHP